MMIFSTQKKYIIWASFLVLLLFSSCAGVKKEQDEKNNALNVFDEMLTKVENASDTHKQAVVDSFITKISKAEKFDFPLISDSLAIFLYRGDISRAEVIGDFNQWTAGADLMTKLEGTNLFYLEKIFPRDARLDYKINNGTEWILDPLNLKIRQGGYGPNSELSMPDYLPPVETEFHDHIKHGTIKGYTFTSQILKNERNIQVYLPPGYENSTEEYPVMYVHDGSEYLELANMRNILDYCIDQKICQPMVVVFVDYVDRMSEYWLNSEFKMMFVQEIIPLFEKEFKIKNEAEFRGVMGTSLGGVTSIYFAESHPDIFGFVGGQSSALWIEDLTTVKLVASTKKNTIRYYLDVGTFEGENILKNNRDLRYLLVTKGNSVKYHEYNEAHSWGNWRAHVDDILHNFMPVKETEN